jgi:hypothetical protein
MKSVLACAGLLAASLASAAEQRLPFDAKTWKLTGDAKFETYLGRASLRARRGGAAADGVSFRDGTVDLDMAVGTHRNFSFVHLRRGAAGEEEEFFVRTHKSELPDAVQYCPAWQGVTAWQLFHGPGFTAKAAFPRDQWFPVRIVISGERAAVFVNGAEKPQLIVSRLRREPRAGSIALGALLLDDDLTAWSSFSNVVLRPGEIPFDFSQAPPQPEPEPPGIVRRWEVSAPFPAASLPVRALPAAAGWQKVSAEASGLVVAERSVKRPENVERPGVLARVTVESSEDSVKELRLGYSDWVTVFLDGRPLFSGDAHYSHDNPRQEGLIGLWQASVYLPLKKGRNELVLAVSDVFGGWGWMAQLVDAAGVRVSP